MWAVYDEVYLWLLPPQNAAAEIYRRLRRYGNLLKISIPAGQTPNEYELSLVTKIAAIQGQAAHLFSPTVSEIRLTIQRIVRMSYRPSERKETVKIQLVRQWRALRWQLRFVWILWLWMTLQQLFLRRDASNSIGAVADLS